MCHSNHHNISVKMTFLNTERTAGERLLRRVTCPNHASFHLETVAGKDSCGPIKKLILIFTKSLPVLKVADAEKFPQAFVFKSLQNHARTRTHDVTWGWAVARLQHRIGTSLTQVRLPGATRKFFSRSQLLVPTLLRCPYTPAYNRKH